MSNKPIHIEKMSFEKGINFDEFDLENEQYIETPWNIIESYFRGQHLERLVRHQLESYNNFVSYQISKTIEMFNPVHIVSEQDYDTNSKKYSLEIFVTFENFHIYRPQIHENNGAIKLMFPQEARLRNFTYASSMTVDVNIKYVVRTGQDLESTQIFYKTLPNINIGKLPIMLKSNICVLNQYKHFENVQTGECKFDAGGYFIINGSEKTVLGQERAAENKVYCFNVSKNNTKYNWIAEIKSVPDFKCISPKQINVMISSKNNGFGNPIFVQIPRIKQPIPLFVVFRALDVISDKEICEKILLDISDSVNAKMLEALQGSIIDANKYLSREECIKYITSFAMYTPINMDRETGAKKKLEFTIDILNNDLFPHCHNITQKIYFLGYMTNKLLQANFDMIKQDDRDSFLNKRIDLTGTLLNNLFRNYFNKLVKDMEKQVIREINTGSWKSKDDYENIINFTNICKIIKSTTIENGLKRALATGDFGIKHTNSNKVGVAQVLNRLTYVSSLSHARRISTPTDKSGKLIPPRKLHNTSWGFVCVAECFDPETMILMWDGTFKRAGDIKIDDILIDDLGNATSVRSTCEGFKNMYDVIPDKKNFMKHRVTDNHILTLKIRGHKRIIKYNRIDRNYTHIVEYLNRDKLAFEHKHFNSLEEATKFVNSFHDDNTIDITIEKYLTLSRRTKDRLVVFKTEGINWEKKDVEMDPYLLGMWLGDGLSDGTGFVLNYKTDFETLAYWEKWAEENGANVVKGKRYGYSVFSKKNKQAYNEGLCNRVEEAPLKKYLRKYNLLKNKHIPNEYLTNDRETRLQVLAGLVDTDGSVRAEGREIRICQGPANYIIIEDAYTLAMSLGFSCSIKEGKSQWTDEKSGNKKFSTYKELTITGHQICEIPTRLPRKKLLPLKNETLLTRSKSFMCSKFKLVEVGVGPYVGWQLHDKRGRFLLKDGMAVHNTPEGQSVGIVKNLSYMAHITIYSHSASLHDYIMPHIINITDIKLSSDLHNKVKVFINGAWVGITNEPEELYNSLKEKKYKGIINIYTSIVFDFRNKELRICNDGGRLMRPLLRVKNNNILITNTMMNKLKNSEINWDDLLIGYDNKDSVLEYIDSEEQSWSMIATKPKDLLQKSDRIYKYTHCEIHPSTIFGVLASCIPFPEHNQSPRNCYQCLDINELVLMADGTHKKIKDVKIGDMVVTFNPETFEISNTKVVNQFICKNQYPIRKLTTIKNSSIIATSDHKFMTNCGWKTVESIELSLQKFENIKIGIYDNFTQKCNFIEITKIDKMPDGLVSDITVESKNHSFIAGNNFLSSNCAQGKQAMGVYVTNYENRMDKTAYVLNYPSRPLVDTRVMNLIQLNKIPSGTNVVVAIMTHTGYNQEDSLLFNKGSIDRGLFVTTIYHTEKDEDKQKINGDEEIRCKPDPTKTKGMKFGNYNKVNSKGVIPENTLVENRDIIIAKVTPIKENRNDHTKVIKFEDQSRIHRTSEETYIDKNYIDRNGEGYNFAKVRLRIVRKPVIGDKFCSLPTQQILTNEGWVEIQDIDITKHKVCSIGTDGNMCYEYPTAKFEYDHNDKMYSIKNKQIEIVCTLNHKLYVQKRSSKKYELIKAEDVMGKMVRFQKSLENVSPDIPSIRIGDIDYNMDAWLQFVGMFISDGHADLNNKSIRLTALKERKIEFDKQILDKLNINYSYNNNGNYYVSGSKYPNVYEFMCKLSLGALNKKLPEFVWSLSKRQAIVLMEALLQGDGTTMKYKGEDEFSRYGTISIQLANDISRLAVHCGWSGIIKIAEEPTGIARTGKRNLGSRSGTEVSITQKNTYYKVSIIRKQNQPWINKKKNESNKEELIDYNGKVYCIEMPSSHTYYMRESQHSPSLIIGNSSRHGQKGTIGNIIPEADMPFTANGLKPDIIINPHAIPSRMTIGQLKETVLGKVLVELGLFGDGTSFGEFEVKDICDELIKLGYEAHGNELLHNGLTGEQVECSVFMGPVFYQRLKHMVNDKAHSRSIGPMVNLTRQPAEGRSRDGGLRFGEMEKDAMVSHGAARFTRGRMYDASDKYSVYSCKKCGLIAAYNDEMRIHHCRVCDNRTDFAYLEIPYACKLLFQELNTMNIAPRFITD
jgi:DNA-directed RNA polymerase beta subunit